MTRKEKPADKRGLRLPGSLRSVERPGGVVHVWNVKPARQPRAEAAQKLLDAQGTIGRIHKADAAGKTYKGEPGLSETEVRRRGNEAEKKYLAAPRQAIEDDWEWISGSVSPDLGDVLSRRMAATDETRAELDAVIKAHEVLAPRLGRRPSAEEVDEELLKQGFVDERGKERRRAMRELIENE